MARSVGGRAPRARHRRRIRHRARRAARRTGSRRRGPDGDRTAPAVPDVRHLLLHDDRVPSEPARGLGRVARDPPCRLGGAGRRAGGDGRALQADDRAQPGRGARPRAAARGAGAAAHARAARLRVRRRGSRGADDRLVGGGGIPGRGHLRNGLPSRLARGFLRPAAHQPLAARRVLPEAAGSQTFYLPYYYVLFQGIFVEPTWRAILATQLLFALPLFALAATAARTSSWAAPPAAFVLHERPVHRLALEPRPAHRLGSSRARASAAHRPALHRGAAGAPSVALAANAACGSARPSCSSGSLAGSASLERIIDRVADPGPLGARVRLRPVSAPLRGSARAARDRVPRDRTRSRASPSSWRAPSRSSTSRRTRATRRRIPACFRPSATSSSARSSRRSSDVRFVVMSDVDQPAMTYYRDELPAVQAYLERFFHIPRRPSRTARCHWLRVLERGADRGATAIDLVALARVRPAPSLAIARGRSKRRPPCSERLATRRNRRPLGFALGRRRRRHRLRDRRARSERSSRPTPASAACSRRTRSSGFRRARGSVVSIGPRRRDGADRAR